MPFLPALPADLAARGLEPGELDFVLVTGDAYVDHPSFGAALIGRLLEAEGYAVGILARPDPDDAEAFRLLGRPRLAFLVTAGALDSMVSSYTANRRPRSEDDYAPGGNPRLCLRADGSLGPGRGDRAQADRSGPSGHGDRARVGGNGELRARANARPDRAAIAYSTRCREAYKGVPVVIGGLEASLRRLSHYDYWSNTVRRSILLDSKADLLVYGMGETQILEAAGRLAAWRALGPGAAPVSDSLRGIRGTAWRSSSRPELAEDGLIELPPYEVVRGEDPSSTAAYAASVREQYRNADARSGRLLLEGCEGRWVVQEPPAPLLGGTELDRLYELPYERAWHPMYEQAGGVPALAEVEFSLASSRGCFGACAFCSLAMHQGRVVTSRSRESLIREARALAASPRFKGYIHDVGGPTANFRAPPCRKSERSGACPDRRCLAPEHCPRLEVDHRDYLTLLRELRSLPGIKKVFVRSGIRFDYLMLDPDESFFRELVEHHVSGQLKVAPEHVAEKVLALMGKPRRAAYEAFSRRYAELNRELGFKQYLVPYFISAHPGSGLAEAVELAEYLRDSGFVPDQVQDFYPTPGTLATAMYWTGLDPLTGQAVYIARGERERSMQRALLQYKKPGNHELVRQALELAGRGDLIGEGPRCLVPRGAAGGRSGKHARRRGHQ
ncbi:MAG TPA: YgiQ family radical SAM protein [Spirochaetales bacterium]|nr:YgiQ family radical SAM protein [Spirochaetales bacterium]HRY53973.1 YgiQ family radical SAM protein [Spirochaetia bacterium]HRZ65113.1 YgiQ family radical SAM protein [Spirochaetia bacterium]